MKLTERIRETLKSRPYWSAARVAEHIGTTEKSVSVTASRHGIKFMSRREFEDWVDGKPVKAGDYRKDGKPGQPQSQQTGAPQQ